MSSPLLFLPCFSLKYLANHLHICAYVSRTVLLLAQFWGGLKLEGWLQSCSSGCDQPPVWLYHPQNIFPGVWYLSSVSHFPPEAALRKIVVKYSVPFLSITGFILTTMLRLRNHSDATSIAEASKRLQRNIKSSQNWIYQGSNLFFIISNKYKSCLSIQTCKFSSQKHHLASLHRFNIRVQLWKLNSSHRAQNSECVYSLIPNMMISKRLNL